MYVNTCTEYLRNESYSCVGYHMTYFSVPDFAENRFLILAEIVFRFWRKSFYDFFAIFSRFWRKSFSDYKKIVSDFFTILFRFWRKSFFDFGENRFLIFSWFLETRFIKLVCIRKNTENIVCKSRDFNTILSTIYSTIFLVWVYVMLLIWSTVLTQDGRMFYLR